DDEGNRDQEVADRETRVQREGGRLDAALVRLELRRIRLAALKGARDQDGRERKRRREQRENQDGKVIRHGPALYRRGRANQTRRSIPRDCMRTDVSSPVPAGSSTRESRHFFASFSAQAKILASARTR